MKWNWQQKDWPKFSWDPKKLEILEDQFLHQAGILMGLTQHLHHENQSNITIDFITTEAIKTSEIEGEYLNRASVQSSIKANFGLKTGRRRIKPAERGIADMMTNLFKNFDQPLSHQLLFNWHKMLTSGRYDLQDIGRYRTHTEPMQIVSSRLDKPKIHFQAPPSKKMKQEMNAFIQWWKKTAPKTKNALKPLTRASIAHLYFVCIHPFEDGNGRIARALTEKSLAEYLGKPSLIALSQTIEENRKNYYDALEKNNKNNQIDNWMEYFASNILKAQNNSIRLVEFLIQKTKLYDQLKNQINPRQEKILERMFREGLKGFKGGLSAENYIRITKTSRATATRDLNDLVQKGALFKTGELKSTRYYLKLVHEHRSF